ncbi:MAG: hypothetical protein AW07_03593 [Candidatus Accumulibacter sp. SK-11]|nr:MAG: hypothetical protein AW07_03593 [Candidatus Accumulibacter sp. SK-11]
MLAQGQSLRARFPCVQDAFLRLGIIAGNVTVDEVEAGGKDQAVVCEIPCGVGSHAPLVGVDAGHRCVYQPDSPVLSEPVVPMDQRVVGTVAAEDFVGGRAGDELLVALDQGDFYCAIAPLAQIFGGRGATEAGTDDDDVPDGLAAFAGDGGQAGSGNAGGSGQRGGCTQCVQEATTIRIEAGHVRVPYFCLAKYSASMAISSSV